MQRRRVPKDTLRPHKQQLRTEHDDANVAVVLRRPTESSVSWLRVIVTVVVAATIVSAVIMLYRGDNSKSENLIDAVTTAFLEWVRAAGGNVSEQISISTFAGMGRGVMARMPIQEHDQLLFIPMDVIICRETILKHLRGERELLSKFEKLKEIPEEMLTAFLILEQWKNSSSFWFPYLRLLPQQDKTQVSHEVSSPLFFRSTGDLDELQDERMQTAATHERKRLKIALQRFRRLFKHYLPITSSSISVDDTYRWARFLINSRAFSIRGDRYLVPFGDMFNGKSQSNRGNREHTNGAHFLDYHRLHPGRGMEIRADRDVLDLGNQVFEDYGDNDNYIYFLHHGFLMEPNPFDCTSVRLPQMPPHDPLRHIKLQVFRDSGTMSRDRNNAIAPLICVNSEGQVANPQEYQALQLYSSLMSVKADTGAEQILKKCAKRELSQTVCSGHANPDEVDSILELAVERHLGQYSTTLVQDLTMLSIMATNDDVFRPQSAIHFRSSRKMILTAALAHIQRRQQTRSSKMTQTKQYLIRPEGEETMEATIARFTAWFATFNPDINYVELKYVSPSMGYGAFATKPLLKGDVYLSVPTDAIMDVHSAMRTSFIHNLFASSHSDMSGVDEQTLLIMHLLHEKFNNNNSFWKPYLDLLPASDRLASPLFYQPGGLELELLETAAPSDVAFLIHEYRRHVDADFQRFISLLSPLPDWITLERFRWANAVLDSRSIWWGSKRHLVPLLDMVNCLEIDRDHEPHTTRLNRNGDVAVTKSSWGFRSGDQIVENYAQPNYIYLLYHGFVLSGNTHDCAHFHFELNEARSMPPQDPVRRTIIEIIERLQIYSWSVDVCIGSQHQDTNTTIERLLWLGLISQSPQRAAQLDRQMPGKLTKQHVLAAKKETHDRLVRLLQGIQTYEDDAMLGRASAARSFISIQHQHMENLSRLLDEIDDRYLDTEL